MYQICQISIQIQVPQNEFQSEIFEKLDVDSQMLGTCGSYELEKSLAGVLEDMEGPDAPGDGLRWK